MKEQTNRQMVDPCCRADPEDEMSQACKPLPRNTVSTAS